MSSSSIDLRRAAREAFDHCEQLFNASHSYWRLGNTFDTLIDYALIDPTVAGNLGEKAQEKYESQGPPSWFDDYGWWGIAAAKAYSTRVFPNSEWFRGVRDHCWERMRPGATVWENADQTLWKSCAPRFSGGMWNSFWTGTTTAPSWAHQCDPCSSGLCGIQNTVTNGLFLILSLRIAAQGGPPEARADAERELRFLQDWGEVPDPDTRLLKEVPNGVLFRERVGTFANGNRMCGFASDRAWAGDQGLMLGATVDWMAQEHANQETYILTENPALRLLTGVKSGGLFLADGTLLPWVGGAPGGDYCDYLTGIGVFLRYLLYAFRNNAELRPLIVQEYRDLVLKNAMQPPYDDPDCGENQTEHEMTLATNRLAALLAALELSRA